MKKCILLFLLMIFSALAAANDRVVLTVPASLYPIEGRLLVTYSGGIGEQIVPRQITQSINIKPSGHAKAFRIDLPTCSSKHRPCATISATTVQLRYKGKLYYSCNYHASLTNITAPAPKKGNPFAVYPCEVVT